MQFTAILQTVLLGWQTVVASALSAVAVTPMSTRAWISLDCTLPRTELVAQLQTLIGVVVDLLLPGMCLHHCTVESRAAMHNLQRSRLCGHRR